MTFRVRQITNGASILRGKWRVERRSLWFWWDNAHPSWGLFNTKAEAKAFATRLTA